METTVDPQVRQTLEQNINRTHTRINNALSKAGRGADEVVLVAVSKKQPLEKIQTAYQLGLRHFGENQIQEATAKVEAFPQDDITWHFIGHLQKNKVRKAVKYFHYLHGVDSMSLLERVNQIAGEERVNPKIFLQVNYAQDDAKSGMPIEDVSDVLKAALAMDHVTCVGLMGIPPQKAEINEVIQYFKGMARLRDQLQEQYAWKGQLSLGMSGDFEEAIMEGAAFIRVGSTIFGARKY